MNIKLLKIIVIFMGVIIILGFIFLCIGIYSKIKNFDNLYVNELIIKKIPDHNIQKYYISNDSLVVEYENENNFLIMIYKISTGRITSKIQLLK